VVLLTISRTDAHTRTHRALFIIYNVKFGTKLQKRITMRNHRALPAPAHTVEATGPVFRFLTPRKAFRAPIFLHINK